MQSIAFQVIRPKETNNVDRQSDRLSAVSCITRKAVVYHWRELPQVSVWRDKRFVATSKCLSQHNTSFVPTKVCLLRQNICRDKMFVDQTTAETSMTSLRYITLYRCMNEHPQAGYNLQVYD